MTIVGYTNRNGQSCSNKMKKHPYIMVVDREEEMVLILKHTLEVEEDEYPINDSSLEESSIAEKILRLLHKLSTMREDGTTSISPLSPRETEILKQIAKGHPNKWIANTLCISKHTVKNHIYSIRRKLDANDRAHAVVLAILNGWLKIEDVSEVRS